MTKLTKQQKAEQSFFRAEAIWQEFINQNANISMNELAVKFNCSSYQVSKVLTAKLKSKFNNNNEIQTNDGFLETKNT